MKTTGVSDIPKFGLLFFLGHPNVDSSPLRTTCIQYQLPTKIPCSLFMVRTLLFINPPHPLDLAVAPPCSHNIYNAALFILKHCCINSKLIFLVSVGVLSWNMVKTSCGNFTRKISSNFYI